MKFSIKQIDEFSAGTDRVEMKDGAIHFHRIPENLAPHYMTPEGRQIRMNCPSGVNIRFVSNTRFLKINLKYGRQARPFFKGEVRTDNTTVNAFGPDAAVEEWAGEIFRQESAERKVFEIWLPHLVENNLVALEAEDGALLEPAPQQRLRWLVYGDSITQGMTATLPTLPYTARCAIELDALTLNLGIGGEIFDKELPLHIPDFECDIISIAYGVNDWNRGLTPDEVGENAEQLVAALARRYADKPVLLITPVPALMQSDTNKIGLTLDEYRLALADAVKGVKQAIVVEGDKILPADNAFFVDGVHPNDKGFELYARNLSKELQAAL